MTRKIITPKTPTTVIPPIMPPEELDPPPPFYPTFMLDYFTKQLNPER